MNKSIILILALGVVIGLCSCRNERFMVKGVGSSVENTRKVGGFTGITLSMNADVELYHDTSFHIELTGQQNILDLIETRVSGSDLKIELRNLVTIRKHDPIKIKVFMPEISNIELSSSGNILYKDDFDSENLNARISGSGDISINGQISKEFSAIISGSGDINCYSNGNCFKGNFVISGSGDIRAENLQCDVIKTVISGSGDQWVYAKDLINADISGSGDIWYKGSPEIISHVSGGGKIRSIW